MNNKNYHPNNDNSSDGVDGKEDYKEDYTETITELKKQCHRDIQIIKFLRNQINTKIKQLEHIHNCLKSGLKHVAEENKNIFYSINKDDTLSHQIQVLEKEKKVRQKQISILQQCRQLIVIN
jgi:hypothetical protein